LTYLPRIGNDVGMPFAALIVCCVDTIVPLKEGIGIFSPNLLFFREWSAYCRTLVPAMDTLNWSIVGNELVFAVPGIVGGFAYFMAS